MKLWRGEQRGDGSILPTAPRGRTARRRGVGFGRCALAKIGDVGVVHCRSVRQMGRGQRTNCWVVALWTRVEIISLVFLDPCPGCYALCYRISRGYQFIVLVFRGEMAFSRPSRNANINLARLPPANHLNDRPTFAGVVQFFPRSKIKKNLNTQCPTHSTTHNRPTVQIHPLPVPRTALPNTPPDCSSKKSTTGSPKK